MTIVVTEFEAILFEYVKLGVSFDECSRKIGLPPRKLTAALQNLVTYNLIKKIKTKEYVALDVSVEIKSPKEVKTIRDQMLLASQKSISIEIPVEAEIYIRGHYGFKKRNLILKQLRKDGYMLTKQQLNAFIINSGIA